MNTHSMSTLSTLKRQQGVSLLEVLISVVVLSIGLLGLAGLQTVSLRNNASAYQRGLATMLAYDVIDRMRADLPNCANFAVAFGDDGNGDVADWKGAVEAALPGGDARVVMANGLITVTIRWDDNRNAVPYSFTTQTTLPTTAPSTCT